MPRKSAAELEMEGIIATMPGEKHERPDPPEDMPEAAAAVWRDAVASMKKMHFSRETHALLTRYCNAMATCSRLEVELARTEVADPNYGRFLKELNTTSTTALSYARALRLTPKSNLESRSTARDPHRILGPKPWELGDYPRSKKPLWER